MTLKEAKKRIAQHVCKCRRDYNTYGDEHVKGEEYGLRHALSILELVDTEPVGNSDKLTLAELAHELSKLFNFRWLTACKKMTGGSLIGLDLFTGSRPEYTDDGYWAKSYVVAGGSLVIPVALLSMDLDLSEYKDENGEIDYSKCIVEVG